MRLATYNVENLFERAKAMQGDSWKAGRETLQQYASLNQLLGAADYTKAAKAKMVALMESLGLEKEDRGPFVLLRRNRGQLLRRPKAGGIEITAAGRADWVGSLELIPAPIDHAAILMTARVMRDVNADVLGVVEAESRRALQRFSDEVLPAVDGEPYHNTMLIEGNDVRGINVGICFRDTVSLDMMRTHVADRRPDGEPIFSRDCPEYRFVTPAGKVLLVLVNHFKSKGYGSTTANDARRRAQAERVRAVYDQRIAEGLEFIAVIGDLNDIPTSGPLRPLHEGTSLQDVFLHPAFDDGGHPGTYGLCNPKEKIDFMLLSPGLFAAVTGGGVFRKGMWPGSKPGRWETYPELVKQVDAGSDHACVFMDFDLSPTGF